MIGAQLRRRSGTAIRLSLIACLIIAAISSGCAPGAALPTAGDTSPGRYDLIIRGGTIIDGTGSPRYQADIGIIGKVVVSIGDLSREPADKVIDAMDLVVAPGFINAHSHTDESYLADRGSESALLQGITTEIGGQDGRSTLDVDRFFANMAKGGCGVNQALLVGHGALRKAAMGNGSGRPTTEQLQKMQDLLRQGMESGAFGLSSGLEYTPGKYADATELAQLASVLVPYGGVYETHMRNEGKGLLAAVDEALTVGRESGAKVELSHLKAVGAQANGLSTAVIAAVHNAAAAGQAVLADVYPYQTPDYAQNLQLGAVYRYYAPDRLVVKVAKDKTLLERSLADIASGLALTPEEAVARLVTDDPGILVYALLESEADLAAFLTADFTVFSDDAGVKPRYGQASAYLVHPRTYGSYPRVFGRFVRDRQLLGLEEAVHKATGKVADFFGIQSRGRIAEGCYADLVIFSPADIADRATFASPQETPVGIACVIVNGTVAVQNGSATGALAGMAIRRGQ